MAGNKPQAGKPPHQGKNPSASGKRPAITIESSFDEKPETKRAAARIALSRERGEGRVTQTSRIIFGSIVGVIIGVPIIAVIWLALLSSENPNRYPPERALEARANADVISQRALALYAKAPARFPAAPTLESFGLNADVMAGKHRLTYEISYAYPAITIVVKDVYAEKPRELAMVVNLETGAKSFNRD